MTLALGIFLGFFVVVFAIAIVRSLVTGKIESFYEGMSPTRKESPVAFWMFLAIQFAILGYLSWLVFGAVTSSR